MPLMSLDGRQRACLKHMGIEVWTARGSPPYGPDHLTESGEGVEERGGSELEPERSIGCSTWSELEAEVRDCTRCPLHATRTQTVFGVGDRQANWMIVGEAPGEQEDRQGEPFVGRAGQLLNEIIRAAGFSRESVYIANLLKCRPPQNRDPSAEESQACESYLKRQIERVKPALILAVGRVAAQNLLKTTVPIGKLRGRVHRYQEIPLVVTYHPAYLLRSQTEKRKAWDDLKLARRTYQTQQPGETDGPPL